uniref:Zinc finger protein-like 1 n=1 Tax=Accipiter nisus TaxID=211598 RepID=A0A8B9NLZ3_9AVES
MGLCKCPKRKVTNLFCFEHRVNVCESCLVTGHHKCIVQSYLQWLQDSDYSPDCPLCDTPLAARETVRLVCYDVFHWSCLAGRARALPPRTAPAGHRCPTCGGPLFPPPNLEGPVAAALRARLASAPWARPGLGLPLVSTPKMAHTPPHDPPGTPKPSCPPPAPGTHKPTLVPPPLLRAPPCSLSTPPTSPGPPKSPLSPRHPQPPPDTPCVPPQHPQPPPDIPSTPIAPSSPPMPPPALPNPPQPPAPLLFPPDTPKPPHFPPRYPNPPSMSLLPPSSRGGPSLMGCPPLQIEDAEATPDPDPEGGAPDGTWDGFRGEGGVWGGGTPTPPRGPPTLGVLLPPPTDPPISFPAAPVTPPEPPPSPPPPHAVVHMGAETLTLHAGKLGG